MPRRRQFDPLKFRRAVMLIAMLKAKQEVKDQIKARGEKISNYSCRDITELAEAYMAQHLEALIAQATQTVARFEEFSPFVCAYVNNHAQNQKPQSSMGSAVQMLGAK